VLLPIAGRPMLHWVCERARASSAAEVIVATDDARIADAARATGVQAVMTAAHHACGTDRIAEVAASQGWAPSDVIVNLQGDEPMMPPDLIDQVAALLQPPHDARADIATLAAPIATLTEFLDPNAVKVALDDAGRALYFSRAPIPWDRDGAAGQGAQMSFAGSLRHIGLYAYRVSAVRRLSQLAPGALEQREKLEQLRALAAGMSIRVGIAAERPGLDVNTPEDLERIRRVVA
jgi:3-deoxy-manno-octulosonate cytidylyltransferase (CMP-KDO synthetase)